MSKTIKVEEREFISYIKNMIEYWDEQPKSSKDKLEGLAFSILVGIDGGAGALGGGYELKPIRDGVVKEDIGGCLHELFYNK
jgi:hypothetical protein